MFFHFCFFSSVNWDFWMFFSLDGSIQMGFTVLVWFFYDQRLCFCDSINKALAKFNCQSHGCWPGWDLSFNMSQPVQVWGLSCVNGLRFGRSWDTVDGRHPAPVDGVSHYLQGFIHPRWCRVSSINSVAMRCCSCKWMFHIMSGSEHFLVAWIEVK